MKINIKESLRSLHPYSVQKERIRIKLDANENPYNLFQEIQEDFIEGIKRCDINRYPDTNSDELRLKIAAHIGVKEENVICGNGSDEIIQMIIYAFVDKGEYVITHRPTFSMYQSFANIVGGKVVEIPCDQNFCISEEEIIKEANEKKAKIIFLCNPNNPTGTVFSKESIRNILQNTESIVVVDEAYYEFFGETVVDWIHDYEQLIVLRTLSKAFALAGARIGYGIAGTSIMDILYRVKPPYNLNVFSQIIGALYLEKSDLIQKSVEKIKKEREYLSEKLREIEHIEVFPSAGNFILIRTPFFSEIMDACKKEGISLRSFPNEALLQNCIRISIGERKENDLLFNTIQEVVR
ncbi:MAG TPA: histidinol-phosphate transaminase [Clostridiales bacterium]|nr:histidinol-phosphate transaminase [Clostridiales bacterium]